MNGTKTSLKFMYAFLNSRFQHIVSCIKTNLRQREEVKIKHVFYFFSLCFALSLAVLDLRYALSLASGAVQRPALDASGFMRVALLSA
jgi:hypothetical protein